MTNICNDKQKLVPTYLDDELAESEARELEEHVSDCGDCREALESAERELTALRAQLRPPAAPPHLEAKLHAALNGIDREEMGQMRSQLWSWSLPAVASAAAAVALGFFIYSELRPHWPGQPSSSPSAATAAAEPRSTPQAPMMVSSDPGQIARSAAAFLKTQVEPPRFTKHPVSLVGWEPGRFHGRSAATFVYEMAQHPSQRVHVHAFSAGDLDLTGHQRHVINGRNLWTDRSFGMNTVTYRNPSNIAYVFSSAIDQQELLELVSESDALRLLDR
jgi:anti-sigma factor RsiW